MSVAAFCAEEGVSPASFYRWRGILGEGIDPRTGAGIVPTAAFVELGALDAPAPSAAGRLEIRLDLGGGLMLTLVRG